MPTPREILVIKPSSLGDVVHTLPAVALLKQHWPAARLRWLINPEWAPLLEGNSFVDESILFPRQELRGVSGLLRILPWARNLRRRVAADLVLDFQGLLRSGLIAAQCRAPGGRIVGLSDAREGAGFFYQQRAPVARIAHAVDRYLALVSALGVPCPRPLAWPLPLGHPPTGFLSASPFVLLHPFSRGAGKSLSDAEVAAFCRALAPARIVLVGRRAKTAPSLANVEDLLNRTTLKELLWLIRQATFVVSVDSGPMHIAAALTSRLLSLHTWSDPMKVGPYRPEAWLWQAGELFQVRDLATGAPRRPAADLCAVADFVRTFL